MCKHNKNQSITVFYNIVKLNWKTLLPVQKFNLLHYSRPKLKYYLENKVENIERLTSSTSKSLYIYTY